MDSSDKSSYSCLPSDAHLTYKCAEFLAQADHGMTYVGGMDGRWTAPTTGRSEAAEYMQVSADLRAQHAFDKHCGHFDAGHYQSWDAAQTAATQFSQAPYNASCGIAPRTYSTSSYESPSYGSSLYESSSYRSSPVPTPLVPGSSWVRDGVKHEVDYAGYVTKTSKCGNCGATFDSSSSWRHCL
jgi:hypothetical protein